MFDVCLLVVGADFSRWISRRGPENVLEARLFSYKACAIFWPKFISFHMASAFRLSIETWGCLHFSVSTWSFTLGLYRAVIWRWQCAGIHHLPSQARHLLQPVSCPSTEVEMNNRSALCYCLLTSFLVPCFHFLTLSLLQGLQNSLAGRHFSAENFQSSTKLRLAGSWILLVSKDLEDILMAIGKHPWSTTMSRTMWVDRTGNSAGRFRHHWRESNWSWKPHEATWNHRSFAKN